MRIFQHLLKKCEKLMTVSKIDEKTQEEYDKVFKTLQSSKDFQKVWEESKLPVDLKSREHTTLSISSMGGNYDAVKYFIEQGADVNARASSFGYTPLMFAAEIAHFNIIELLLDNGADTGTFGRQAKSAPLVLLISNYEIRGNTNDYWKCMDLLLEKTSSRYYREVLEETYYRDHKDIFLYILNKNSIPFKTISNVISPFMKNSSPLDDERKIHKVWLTKKFYDKLETNLNQNTNSLNNKMKI